MVPTNAPSHEHSSQNNKFSENCRLQVHTLGEKSSMCWTCPRTPSSHQIAGKSYPHKKTCQHLKFSTVIGEIANSNRGISLCESPRKMYPRGVILQDYVNVIKQLENEMAVKKLLLRLPHHTPGAQNLHIHMKPLL